MANGFPRRMRKVKGDGTLWRCVVCNGITRSPEGHWKDEHLDVRPFNLVTVWECFSLLSNARKHARAERVATPKPDEPRLF